jgi:hypothetical protein
MGPHREVGWLDFNRDLGRVVPESVKIAYNVTVKFAGGKKEEWKLTSTSV